MKTRIPRDVATARRPGRPISAAMSTACWAQAETDRARIRTVLRAPPDWRGPATTSAPASTTKHGAAGAPIAGRANVVRIGGHALDPAQPRAGERAETIPKHGISGSRTSLPYLDRVQASLGAAHILSSTSVHERAQQYLPGRTCGSERPSLAPVPRLPGPIQRKLKVGAVNDPLEHEADRMAARVMQMPTTEGAASSGPVQISRKCTACADEQGLQKQSTGTVDASATASPAPDSVHAALCSPGQPLDASVRAYFEPRFGHHFSRVRVHSGSAAEQSARDVSARAYTVGDNIVFGAGHFAPGSSAGLRLLAHELTHIVQNTATTAANLIRRTPDPPPPPQPPAKIVSPVWNVQGRAVVVVEFGGRRKAFYRRTGSADRPEGHAGPQEGDWAPFDGWKPSTKRGEDTGHFQKENYHRGMKPTDPLHGYGNERNKEVSDWLGQQNLQRPGPERPWQEVQVHLEKLGVNVSRPMPAAPTSPQATIVSGQIGDKKGTGGEGPPPPPPAKQSAEPLGLGEKPPPKAPPPGPEISRGAFESPAAAGQEATTGAVGGAAVIIHQGQVQNLQNYEQQKAEDAFKKIEPIVNRLTSQGAWVAVKFYFDAPKAPNLLAGVFKEQSDISRFLWVSYSSGDTKQEALGEQPAKMDVAPLDVYEAPKNPLGKDRTGHVAEVRISHLTPTLSRR